MRQKTKFVPEGQLKTDLEITFQSSLRDENLFVSPVFPALTCWATIKRPSGTENCLNLFVTVRRKRLG